MAESRSGLRVVGGDAGQSRAPVSGYERIADWLLLTFAFFLLGASYKTTEVLLVGDWNMWFDWKDREWWPLLYPLIAITFPAIAHGILWSNFRIPFGATLA